MYIIRNSTETARHQCYWGMCSTFVDWDGFTFCFSAPCCLCLCPCPFPFSQSPSFSSINCQNRAEMLECLWGMAGEKWGKEVVFVGLRALYLSIAMRGERCVALCFTFCCSFHFCPVMALRTSPTSEIGSAGEWEVSGRKERDLACHTVP